MTCVISDFDRESGPNSELTMQNDLTFWEHRVCRSVG